MRSRRRSRRLLAGIAVAVAAAVAWHPDLVRSLPLFDQSEPARVAGMTYEADGQRAVGDASDIAAASLDGAVIDPVAEPWVPEPAAPASPGETAIAPPPDTFDGRPAVVAPPPAPLRSQFDGVQPEGGTWAVMIGINDYPGSSHDLHSAVNDAADVNEALARLGVAGDHRLLLKDRQASAPMIRTAVDWLNAHAGPDAVAVFFYAGHVRKLDANTEAMVGADGALIPDVELARRMDGLAARQVWIALASCYSGGFDEVLKPGRVLTAAAGANSLAYENDELGRSYLVEYMVRRAMIQGRAPSSVEAAFAWARAEIEREHPNREPVQLDTDPVELDLRPYRPGVAAATAASGGGEQSSSASSGADSGSSSSGGSGSGSGSGGDASEEPPPTTTTTAPDSCSRLTVGVIRCDKDG